MYSPSLTAPTAKIPDHIIWTVELDKYVSSDGLVDYQSWQQNQDNLDSYLQLLSVPLPLSNWSQNVQLAYWINIHNAYTIKLVLQHYPINSLTELFDGKPWSEVWISLGEKEYSLEQIQNETRHQFNEPRAHFALNHGTNDSAPLLNEAYSPDQLNEQLEFQTKRFINNSSFNNTSDSTAILSPIFARYEADFKPDILSFIKDYIIDTTVKNVRMEFLARDATINKQ